MRAFILLLSCYAIADTQSLHAEIVLQPDDLNPGDEYRLMFVTSTTRDATSKNIDDYSDFVQGVADAAPVVGAWDLEWKAFGSTTSVDARDHLNVNPEADPLFPVYLLNGELFSAGNIAAPQTPIYVTELGTAYRGDVFTGTNRFGVAEPGDYLGAGVVAVGSTIGGGNNNFSNTIAGKQETLPFYAFSEVITAVPEPCGFCVVIVGVSLLLGFREKWWVTS